MIGENGYDWSFLRDAFGAELSSCVLRFELVYMRGHAGPLSRFDDIKEAGLVLLV